MPDSRSQSVAWSDDALGNPHAVADKAARVRSMFSAIAPSYDLNNRLHSLWQDQAWRRAAVRQAAPKATDVVLDVACGTGDLAMAFRKAGAQQVLGVDFTYDMLAIARQKVAGRRVGVIPGKPPRGSMPGLDPVLNPKSEIRNPRFLRYAAGDALRLPLPDACVDIVSIAFGIRNVADPARAVAEFRRVLRPGGRLVILEFSLPGNSVLRGLYRFYFERVMPRTASWIAGDRSGAYRYLPRSVNTFIDRTTMTAMMQKAGFAGVTLRPLTLGIAVIYRGVRP
ncbi:MAG: class I SAM-dependent methyltransferase [Phycisphaeraceae bacterium]